jgi:hypothetical protein
VLEVNEDGLMRVTVPGPGTIDLVFHTTSMKRRGGLCRLFPLTLTTPRATVRAPLRTSER